MKNVLKGSIFYVIIAIIVVLGINYIRGNLVENTGVTYSQFQKYVAQNKVSGVEVRQNSQGVTGELTVHLKDGEYRTLDVSDVTKAEDLLEQKNISYKVTVEKESVFMTTVLPMLLICVIFMVFFTMGSRQATGGNARMMNFGKSRATLTMPDNSKVTFKDVAGLQEEKEDLQEIVDFLKEPKKYLQVGARIPKGVLLVGPPGTGKTLLAKAVAGEANVPFFSMSGSSFVEMYVGVGASRVRDLFKQATQMAPCIIFIDEIDAIGRSRDSRHGGDSEREQTLNQLLAEMDGFDTSKGIVILAATNRPEVLDKALLRPGRFDRRVIVEKPDLKERIDTLKVHSKNVKMDETVDLHELALATSGAVGADLANIINEGALAAVRDGRSLVSQQDLIGAVEVVFAGKEKKDRLLSKEEKQIVAYHEVGHALLAAIQKHTEPIQRITIVPRTMGSLGYVWQVPEEEKYLESKKELEAELITLLGGRAAEELKFDSVTTGASNDIEKATKTARAMITMYGMSDKFGMVQLESVEGQYLDRNLALQCSDETATKIDKEIRDMLRDSYNKAKRLLSAHMAALDSIASFLIEHETITGKEFMSILAQVEPQR